MSVCWSFTENMSQYMLTQWFLNLTKNHSSMTRNPVLNREFRKRIRPQLRSIVKDSSMYQEVAHVLLDVRRSQFIKEPLIDRGYDLYGRTRWCETNVHFHSSAYTI